MWLCTNWAYNAEAVAAWGTWAAVVVAMGVALTSSVSRWMQRRVDARLLAISLFHEVAHANSILETVRKKVMPGTLGGLVEALIEMEPAFREEIAFHIDRILLPALEKSVNRLSVLPRDAAITVGELQSNLAFLGQGGRALATRHEPPPDVYQELCANLQECLTSAAEARHLLLPIAFPNGRPTRDSEAGAAP